MEIVRKTGWETLLLFVLCLAAFFVNNNMLPTDPAEAKTIVTAREIVANDNWMSPTMNGESRIDRPPLAVWVAASVEKVYPGNISVQRSVVALLATMWALFFYGVARYMERRRGFAELATVVFLTSYNVIYHGRMVHQDIYGYSLMMGAIYFLFRLLYDERYYAYPHKWRWAILAGFMMGLSFLGDGIEPFYSMLLPLIIVILLLKRPAMEGRWMPLVLLCVICVLTFGWRIAYLMSAYPEYHLAGELSVYASDSTRPWYYYWRFFAEMGVWTLLLVAAFFIPYWYKRLSTKRLYGMSMAWLVIALVLLSAIPNKEMTDLLPLVPPCALIVACLLFYFTERWPKDKWGKGLFFANGYLMTLLAFGLPFFVHFRMTNWYIIDFGTSVFIAFFLFAIAIYLLFSTTRKDMTGIVRGVTVLFLIIECFMLGAVGNIFINPKYRSISLLQKNGELKSLPIYYNKEEALRIELVYAANKSILPLDLNDGEAVEKAAPCLLLTQKSLASESPDRLLQRVDTLHLGVYDDNRLPRHNRHYGKALVNHVTMLKPKANSQQPKANSQ